MAPKSLLCRSHRKWADTKLRSLLEAHYEDGRRGGGGTSYADLLDYYMEEYERMPFAKGDFVEYLGPDGQPLFKDWELRKMARRYFHNHADPNKLATLEAFEGAGGQSEPHPERALCASEIWAAGAKDRIHALTCAELQIDLDTPATKRPNGWIGARKTVVKREFSMLPEADQARWEDEAQAQRASGKSKRAQPIAVQRRQKQFFGDLANFIKKRMVRGGLGEHFVVVYQGFYVDPVAHRLSRFRGQQESFDVPKWHLSPGYDASYSRWINYIEPLVKGLISKDLPTLPDGAVGAELVPFRAQLREHLELLFKLTCALQEPLDVAKFWAEVHNDPAHFVDPARLPPGTRFKNPELMLEHDFVFIYKHVFECYWAPESVEDDKRFLYEQAGIHRFVGEERARRVQASTTVQPVMASGIHAQPSTSGASMGGTSTSGTVTGGATVGGSAAGASSRASTPASTRASTPTNTQGTSPACTGATSPASSGAASPPPTGVKRKSAPGDNDSAGTRSMAQEGYITRNIDTRRSPPPKKMKTGKANGIKPKTNPVAAPPARKATASRGKGRKRK